MASGKKEKKRKGKENKYKSRKIHCRNYHLIEVKRNYKCLRELRGRLNIDVDRREKKNTLDDPQGYVRGLIRHVTCYIILRTLR